MNHSEADILPTALESLFRQTGFRAEWIPNGTPFDGEVILEIDGAEQSFRTVVRKDLSPADIPTLEKLVRGEPFFLLIAWRLNKRTKEKLRQRTIPYLEANGNFYFKQGNTLIFLDTQKPFPLEKKIGNRAFTKTGLKVLFQLLLKPDLIHQPQREIAEAAGVALGNIPKVLDGLLSSGFIIRSGKKKFVYEDRKMLLDRWVVAYQETLRPSIVKGRYTLMSQAWKEIPLDKWLSQWGGEAAGEILTNHLRAEDLCLYTNENRQALIKKYGLRPAREGEIQVLNYFFNNEHPGDPTVPPLLIYADLIRSESKRCRDTADRIFDEYLRKII